MSQTPKTQSVTDDMLVRSIKIVDIGYSAFVYFVSAFVYIYIIRSIETRMKLEDVKKTSTIKIIVRLLVHTWLIGVGAYITRNIYEKVPFLFEGVKGYQHLRTKEVVQSAVFTAFAVVLDTGLSICALELKNRMDMLLR